MSLTQVPANMVLIASQAEAEAGVIDTKMVTPQRLKQAIDAQRAFASQAEAEAGADNTKVITSLRAKQAMDVLRAYASQAEAEAGANNTKMMTPLRVAQAIAALGGGGAWEWLVGGPAVLKLTTGNNPATPSTTFDNLTHASMTGKTEALISVEMEVNATGSANGTQAYLTHETYYNGGARTKLLNGVTMVAGDNVPGLAGNNLPLWQMFPVQLFGGAFQSQFGWSADAGVYTFTGRVQLHAVR